MAVWPDSDWTGAMGEPSRLTISSRGRFSGDVMIEDSGRGKGVRITPETNRRRGPGPSKTLGFPGWNHESQRRKGVLGTGVNQERRPVEGSPVIAGGVDQAQLGFAQCGGRILARTEVFVHFVHQLRRGGIAHFPQTADDVASAGAEEGPGEADKPLASIGFDAAAVASRDGDKVSAERVREDVASVELE